MWNIIFHLLLQLFIPTTRDTLAGRNASQPLTIREFATPLVDMFT
jgi:hypothetical protein